MVEIRGLIHEFNVGETQKKGDDGQPIFESDGHKKSRNPTNSKNKIGIVANRFDPFKTIIGKVKFGQHVESFNPSMRPKADNTQEHHHAKAYPEDG